jgi:hypothetical protein
MNIEGEPPRSSEDPAVSDALPRPRRRRRAAAVVVATLLAAALATVAVASILRHGVGSAAQSGGSGAVVVVGDGDNGRTLSVSPGTVVTLILGSTYWTVGGSSNDRAVAERGSAVASPGGASCPHFPGSGCGTVTATFVAAAAGRADLTASRVSCGEALACAPGQRSFVLTIVVS